MKTKWVKKSTLGYSATQCFGIWGHGDSFIYGIMCFEIGLLLVLFATNIIIIVRAKSHLRDTITSVWYYVSHRRDTSLRQVLLDTENNIWQMCSLHLKLFLEQNFFSCFLKIGISNMYKVSRLHATITETWYSVYFHA